MKNCLIVPMMLSLNERKDNKRGFIWQASKASVLVESNKNDPTYGCLFKLILSKVLIMSVPPIINIIKSVLVKCKDLETKLLLKTTILLRPMIKPFVLGIFLDKHHEHA